MIYAMSLMIVGLVFIVAGLAGMVRAQRKQIDRWKKHGAQMLQTNLLLMEGWELTERELSNAEAELYNIRFLSTYHPGIMPSHGEA